MKRKFADRRGWKRVKEKRYSQFRVDDEHFNGYIAVVEIDRVIEPLFVSVCGKQRCVVDNGYIWMQFFPDGCAYVMTVMFDTTKTIIEWYFDICKKHGLGSDSIPYLDDLFLDVVVSPEFEIELIDQDELEAALTNNLIEASDYSFAYKEANQLIESIKSDELTLMSSCLHFLNEFVYDPSIRRKMNE
jgi:hypothetical protein